MADQILDAFESRKRQTNRFLFSIASHGGSVAEGERVIEVLNRLKASHALDTIVKQGDVCAAMCVFIYVQGQRRYGALTSSWLFHEISLVDPVTEHAEQLDRPGWERLVDRYFRPAGVSDAWIADLKARTVATDYWQTGADLIRSNSGIIHEPLANQISRVVAPGARSGEGASAQPARPTPVSFMLAQRIINPAQGSYHQPIANRSGLGARISPHAPHNHKFENRKKFTSAFRVGCVAVEPQDEAAQPGSR